jgi:hypothetical protein
VICPKLRRIRSNSTSIRAITGSAEIVSAVAMNKAKSTRVA